MVLSTCMCARWRAYACVRACECARACVRMCARVRAYVRARICSRSCMQEYYVGAQDEGRVGCMASVRVCASARARVCACVRDCEFVRACVCACARVNAPTRSKWPYKATLDAFALSDYMVLHREWMLWICASVRAHTHNMAIQSDTTHFSSL
jgi:hypothetical protein